MKWIKPDVNRSVEGMRTLICLEEIVHTAKLDYFHPGALFYFICGCRTGRFSQCFSVKTTCHSLVCRYFLYWWCFKWIFFKYYSNKKAVSSGKRMFEGREHYTKGNNYVCKKRRANNHSLKVIVPLRDNIRIY